MPQAKATPPTPPPPPPPPPGVLVNYTKTEAAIFENLFPQQKDTSQMICKINQSTGFYMMALLALNGLTLIPAVLKRGLAAILSLV